MEHRDDTGGWLYRMILAAWVMFIVILVAFAIKSVHHEFSSLTGDCGVSTG